MATATKPRKKYNPVAKRAKLKRWALDRDELKFRTAMQGVIVSYNSEWKDCQEMEDGFCLSEADKAIALVHGKVDMVKAVAVTWFFDWHIVLTIYTQTEFGVKDDFVTIFKLEHLPMQTPEQPESPYKLIGVEDLIEKHYLPTELKKRNPNHVVSWGYMATITYIEPTA